MTILDRLLEEEGWQPLPTSPFNSPETIRVCRANQMLAEKRAMERMEHWLREREPPQADENKG